MELFTYFFGAAFLLYGTVIVFASYVRQISNFRNRNKQNAQWSSSVPFVGPLLIITGYSILPVVFSKWIFLVIVLDPDTALTLLGIPYIIKELIKGEGTIVNEMNQAEKPIQKIVYEFHDASVPPQDHRSYVITVTQVGVTIVIDSYGDILADSTYEITQKQFETMVESLRKNGIKNIEAQEHEGCTGGTGESISYFSEGEKIFSGTVYHCGDIDLGNLGGNLKSFAQDVEILIPKWPL